MEEDDEKSNVTLIILGLIVILFAMANKTARNKKKLKYFFIALALGIGLSAGGFLVGVLVHGFQYTSEYETAYMTCELDGEQYFYNITYDDQYQIMVSDGDSFIADHVATESYSDANILIAQIQNYFTENGGSVQISFQMKNNAP